MPFLALVHLRELACRQCGALLAEPGARSFIVDTEGSPVFFDEEGVPEEMSVEVQCPNGHPVTLLVPSEISAEETSATPDDSPIGADAVLKEI